MRILILTWKDRAQPAAGGAEVFTEEVARELVSRGHAVTLSTSAVPGRAERETVDGVDIVRAGGRLAVYREARRLWSRRTGSFDVVVDEINTRPFMTPRWIHDTPVVALIFQLAREVWFTEMPFPVALLGRYVLEPWWLRAYRTVPALTISDSSAASLREHHAWTDVTVVPVGLGPITRPDAPKEERPTVVFLGRLVGMKRPEDAIRAFSRLRNAYEDAQLWMIGTGPLEQRLRAAAPPGVELLGRVSSEERAERLARAHVLVATSLREGWGLNVSEAAACGTPSIGYAVPGLVDSVRSSGGAVVEEDPDVLGETLVQFFHGKLPLTPQVSTATWPEVADAVERRLLEVISELGPRAGVDLARGARDRPTFRHRGRERTRGQR